MHRPDSDYDKPLTGCAIYAVSAILVAGYLLAELYEFLAVRLHW